MIIRLLLLTIVSLSFSSNLIAECDDGRVPCSHKCNSNQRPACKDSKGSDGKPYCVTPSFCRDGKKSGSQNNCDKGWSTRDTKCTKKQRKRGCKDSRGKIYGYCIKY